MHSENFFTWLKSMGATETPSFGNRNTQVYVLNDDITEVAVYSGEYAIENARGNGNALVIQSITAPVRVLLNPVRVNGFPYHWGYDTFSDTVYVAGRSELDSKLPEAFEGELD